MITLVVEASTYHGSAAIIDGQNVLATRSVAMRGRDHEALMPAVAEVVQEAGISPASLDCVICGAGPGSFTSLRISAAIAKGIALSAAAPLIPVSSLALLVASQNPLKEGRYLPALDAMRGDFYIAVFEVDADGLVSQVGPARVVPAAEVAELAIAESATVIGPGGHGEANVVPQASAASRLTNMIDAADPADLAAWEPGYGRLAEAQVKWEAQHGRPLQG
jgi:tRNA threonylcarbamoyladenosine biosynthesis protein TsaB